MADTVDQLLRKNNLNKNDVSHWFVHAGIHLFHWNFYKFWILNNKFYLGGPKMLKYFENEYGLNKNQLRHCWSALAEVGNVSSH